MSGTESASRAPASGTSNGASSRSATDPDLLADRNIRQRDIIPQARIDRVHAIVIGVGAIGRPLCEQLAVLGVRKYTVFDPDAISVENLGVQGWKEADLHGDKAMVCSRTVRAQYSLAAVVPRCHAFRPEHAALLTMSPDWDNVVFCCVDSIETRAEIWNAVRGRCRLWIDSRMNAETIRLLVSDCPATDDYYETQLFTSAEAQSGACTARSLVYGALGAVVMAMAELSLWLRDMPIVRDQMQNLTARERVILKE